MASTLVWQRWRDVSSPARAVIFMDFILRDPIDRHAQWMRRRVTALTWINAQRARTTQ
jgi:hypothetical protein